MGELQSCIPSVEQCAKFIPIPQFVMKAEEEFGNEARLQAQQAMYNNPSSTDVSQVATVQHNYCMLEL